MRGNDAFSDDKDGTVGVAHGVRRLSLGQGSQSSFCYIYGSGHRPFDGGPRADCALSNPAEFFRKGRAATEAVGLACQVVLRAPSDGILIEYASSLSRCLTLTLRWLEWDTPSRCIITNPSSFSIGNQSEPASCLVVAGGGASELSLHLLFRELATRSKAPVCSESTINSEDMPRDGGREEWTWLSAADRGSTATQPASGVELPSRLTTPRTPTQLGNFLDAAFRERFPDETDVGGAGRRSLALAFDVLAEAMAVVPRSLLGNAYGAPYNRTPTQSTRFIETRRPPQLFRLEHTLKNMHAEGQFSAGLEVRKTAIGVAERPTGSIGIERFYAQPLPDKTEGMIALSCGLKRGVVHPLVVKYGMLAGLLDAMIISLRVGGVMMYRGKLNGTLEESKRGEEVGESSGGGGC